MKAWAYKAGKMGLSMRASGSRTRQMGMADSFLILVIIILANGKITKPMGLALTSLLMDANILVHGKVIYNMVLGWRRGRMEISMKENLSPERDIILGLFSLHLETSLLVNFKIIK